MRQIEIHCPYHGEFEEIQLPDGYLGFEGEVRCASGAPVGSDTGPFVLRIKLARGEVVEVARAMNRPA